MCDHVSKTQSQRSQNYTNNGPVSKRARKTTLHSENVVRTISPNDSPKNLCKQKNKTTIKKLKTRNLLLE